MRSNCATSDHDQINECEIKSVNDRGGSPGSSRRQLSLNKSKHILHIDSTSTVYLHHQTKWGTWCSEIKQCVSLFPLNGFVALQDIWTWGKPCEGQSTITENKLFSGASSSHVDEICLLRSSRVLPAKWRSNWDDASRSKGGLVAVQSFTLNCLYRCSSTEQKPTGRSIPEAPGTKTDGHGNAAGVSICSL